MRSNRVQHVHSNAISKDEDADVMLFKHLAPLSLVKILEIRMSPWCVRVVYRVFNRVISNDEDTVVIVFK